jgi:uncharacterized protein (TIGR02117 family)
MRRWAIGLSIGLLALIYFLVVTTIVTTRYGDPTLWPARDARIVEVYVVSNGYHTGIALPRERLAEFASGRGYPALLAVTQRFNQFPWVEIGWGDEEFYRKVPTVGDLTLPIALRALFRPGNKSVLHVVGLPNDPVRTFPSAEIVAIPLSWNGFDQMLAKLDATFVPPQNGALPDLGKGLYGPSLFYPAVGTFNIFHVCNHWIADLLNAAGVPTSRVPATFATGLLLDLRWRSGLRANSPSVIPAERRESRDP